MWTANVAISDNVATYLIVCLSSWRFICPTVKYGARLVRPDSFFNASSCGHSQTGMLTECSYAEVKVGEMGGLTAFEFRPRGTQNMKREIFLDGLKLDAVQI